MPFSGEVTRKRSFHRNVSGTLSFFGNVGVGRFFKRSLSGILSFTGAISTFAFQRTITGILSGFSSKLTRIKNGVPIGPQFVRKFLQIGKTGVNFANGFFRIGK